MLNNPSSDRRLRPATIIFLVVIILLIVAVVFAGMQYINTKNKLDQAYTSIRQQSINQKILDFTDFFIKSVLLAKSDVDFETRLKLESAVRDLNDKEVFDSWNRFVKATDDQIAQQEAKNLLFLLVSKVKVQ